MTRDELLQLIDRAAREQWTELDLRDEEITEIPPEIGQLTRLEELSIGSTDDPDVVRIFGIEPNPLTSLPSEIGLLSNLRELDLSNNQLTAVPPEIGCLTNLHELDLSNNQLTAVPPEIGRLTSLHELDLRGNQLTAVPPKIGRLISLQKLDLSQNQLTVVPSEIGNLTNLQELELDWHNLTAIPETFRHLSVPVNINLSIRLLTTLPEGIGNLTSLQELDLSEKQLTVVPPEICRLTSLQSLDLNGNQLTELPSEIGHLTNLTHLDLDWHKVKAIPPEFKYLTSLTTLDLSDKGLTRLPPGIANLINLTQLDLSGNQLTELPPEIGHLTSLQSLDLRWNQLTEFPLEIGHLTNLTHLDLDWHKVKAIPPEFKYLTSLTTLDLSLKDLTSLPPGIANLINLTQLDLSWNQLTELPSEIDRLTNLQLLVLSINQLTKLPSEIGRLTNLQELVLSGNQLMELPPEIGRLTRLQWLDLSNNQLTTLPAVLRRLTKLEKLHLYENPLPLPLELLGHGDNPGNPQAILDAYFQASRPLREAKLLLVGEGSVGKTSLVERLLWNKPPSDSGKTVGVDIHGWEVEVGDLEIGDSDIGISEDSEIEEDSPDTEHASRLTNHTIRLHVWDFGGQEIYHATHQFFLTHRSLYLLVIESRKDEAANRLDYWLRHIASFAGESPVILVVNKSEDDTVLSLDKQGWQEKYTSLREVVYTSCVTGKGIPELRGEIEKALASIPHLNDWIPETWFAVKEKLAALARQKDYLPYETFIDLCQAEGIEAEAAQRTLSRFLHDLGVALHFQDDPRLAGTNVLNPEWVTGGIYQILNADRLQENGILRLADLDGILDGKRYPAHKRPFLLDVMHKFELSVSLDGERYLIPGLLPKERPDFAWPEAATVVLEYRYAALPASVLSRLMVRLHGHTWQGADGRAVRWRNGIVLANDRCRALVTADTAAHRLTIALDGVPPHRRHLLVVIRAELAEIHAAFARLEAEEWVPLPGKPGAAIRYHALLNLEARDVNTYYDPNYDVDIDVPALLDGIESPDVRRVVRQLLERYNKAELRQLAFDLELDHENLSYEVKPDLAREMALYFERRGRLAELIRKIGA